jgi:hypothetical protein
LPPVESGKPVDSFFLLAGTYEILTHQRAFLSH